MKDITPPSDPNVVRCGFVPNSPAYAPCTREKGHEGPCAHPLSFAGHYRRRLISVLDDLIAKNNRRIRNAWILLAVLLVATPIVLYVVLRPIYSVSVVEEIPSPDSEPRALTAVGEEAPVVWGVFTKPDGTSARWKTKATSVQFETSHGLVSVSVEGDEVYLHSVNLHELRPRWRAPNAMTVDIVEEKNE